jgi:tartrate-resistant acid phosphatase type 5
MAQEEVMKFCLLGDLGMGTDFQKAIARSLKKENCDRIAFLGDLVYPAGISSSDDPELEEKFLKYYSELFDDNPNLKILLLLGNHDHQGTPLAWRYFAEKDERFFFPYYFYFIDYGGLCLVALDTSLYFYPKLLLEANEQASWLRNLQSRLKECDVKVALSHHPYKGSGYSGSKNWKGAQGVLKIFLETYVIGIFDVHVAGHVHILADDEKEKGTRMLISGTGGENLGDDRSGYVVLTWSPSNPKRIGYRLKYVDPLKEVDDGTFPQKQVDEREWDETISKASVEGNIFQRFIFWLNEL